MCFNVFGCVWERNQREKRERICPKTTQKSFQDCPKTFLSHIWSGKGRFGHFIKQKAPSSPFGAANFGGLFEGLPKLELS